MKKSISETFKNCTVCGDVLIEIDKEETYEHDIMAIFRRLDGVEGLNITIKKDSQYGAIKNSARSNSTDTDYEDYDDLEDGEDQ